MIIRLISNSIKYLLLNPRYFFLYFYGKPAKVISALTGEPERTFYKFKEELDSNSDFIKKLRERTQEHTNENFSLDIDCYFLYSLVRIIKPSVILETGVFDGYLTACFLKGIHDNYRDLSIDGKVISIDLPAYEAIPGSTSERAKRNKLPPGCEPGWVIPEYLKDRWELHIGDSRDLLPEVLKRDKNISLFFHDSLHTYAHMTYEFETVFPVLDQGSYLISHDIHWSRAFRDFVKKYNQKDFSTHGFGVIKKTNGKI